MKFMHDFVTSQIATVRTSGNSSGLTQKCSRRFIYFQMTTHKAQVGANSWCFYGRIILMHHQIQLDRDSVFEQCSEHKISMYHLL